MKPTPRRGGTPTAPRAADRLLNWFVAPHLFESIQGDMHEEFDYQVEHIGERRARWRYWWEVLGFLKPRFISRLKSTYSTPNTTDMLQNYVKIALRNLVRNKTYSGINIIGLALGLACCTAIGLYVLDELQYDRFHANTTGFTAW